MLGAGPSLNNLIRFGIVQSDVVTAVPHSLIKEIDYLVNPNKDVQTVHNFIAERVYCKRDMTQFKKEYGISESDKLLLHFSNFRQENRRQVVLQASSKLVI
ncbi:hypothetical protein BUE63_14550 [Bacillus sp. MB353a]|nr:hypothetical protein BUE63_14550 [Bacillus sp. MB353a]